MDSEIDTFWTAWDRVFHTPGASPLCGSHVHVSVPKGFDLPELRRVAFGAVYYEPLVTQLLPRHRQDNKYCRANSQHSAALKELARSNGGELDLSAAWEGMKGDFVQKGSLGNFDNILPGCPGTVEFRGAPGVRDAPKTKRWIAFAVAFLHLCLGRRWTRFKKPEIDGFWQDLLKVTESIHMRLHLPGNWTLMVGGQKNVDGEKSPSCSTISIKFECKI
ncbi:hypothetical protein jhhlp_001236 [Lomentospora prolificans]|uniref:Amidoligase enzyme n=1 Tax=Lomentospora prolificans TaxID=41688 RepID=A0A2N3NHM9_9PEZI|nr:hypothetical protein jhhlp_001236 [Lomentospora prolificans]